MGNFQEVFMIIVSLFANLKLMSVFTHEAVLVYKMETFKNFKEVKHIMIMVIDYDFLCCVIFDQQLKITFKKSSGPPEKIHSPLFTHPSPCKNSKSASPLPFLLTLKIFQAPLLKGVGGRHCINRSYTYAYYI